MSLNQVPDFSKTPNEKKLIVTVNELILGNGNNFATVTLTENTTTTTVKNSRINANTYIEFMPTTANAATEKASGSMYVSERKSGEYTITHANNSQTDRTFTYLYVG